QKKRPGKVAELESHIAQLQEELKKAKDQLNASESCKRQAQQEAEDTKKQLMELTASEDTRVEELTRISHDRDRAWQSELEAIQKQHSMDSTALATAMNEIQRLKNQLQFVTESEATQSKELVSKLQKLSVEASADSESSMETTQNEETNRLKEEMNSLKVEVCELRADLEASETRYQEEYVQSTLQIRGAYEQVEKMKQESGEREAEMEAELKKAKAYIDELKAILTEETHPSELETDLKKLEHDFTEMKASLLEKETQVESLAEQNEMLKMAANSEMEAELRRLKVQADQWRKAAEAAASMLSTGNNNGKFVERTGSLDSSNNVNYTTIAGAMVGSPFSEDMDDDSMKKKNGNVLKKIGVFWKKGH
ncbi:Interactor of constitutive active ROPs 5, partial [Linum perenne]